MSEPEINDPYRVPEHSNVSEDLDELRAPGVLAVCGIVIVSLASGFAGLFGTCFGGFILFEFLSWAGFDNVGPVILLVSVLGLFVAGWLMVTVSRVLYRVAAKSRGSQP